MWRALAWLGRHARYCLIVGLLVGLLSPQLAELLKPWIGGLVALLLFVTGARIGVRQALGSLDDLVPTLARIGFFQTVLPLAVIGVLHIAGLSHFPLALAVSLMLAAPSLTGAPNFAIMAGLDPAPNMRLLVLGTALFPLTAFPVVLVLDPTGGGALDALSLSFGLLGAILGAVGLGFAARAIRRELRTPTAHEALDGCAALLLAVVVVGLMSEVGTLLLTNPGALGVWVLTAIGINLALVTVTWRVSRLARLKSQLATAIFAGNRNIALFLIVLPHEIAAPLMIFVGCYQIPMYLTPVLLTHLRRRANEKQI